MDNKKKISLVMATLMTVQASLQPIAVLAQEVEPEQEEIIVENTEIEEGKAEEVVEKDNQEQPKEEVTEENKVPSAEEKESSKELVNEESVVIEKETENQDSVVPQATTHVLSKAKFHQYLIDSQDLTALRFVASEVPAGIDVSNQADLSENGDRSVIGYRDGRTGIITSGIAGQSVELPVDSSYLVGAGFNDPIYNFIYNLTSISFEAIDTSKVTDMSHMFDGPLLYSLTLDVSNFDTSNVTNMSCMFKGLYLSTLDVGNFNTSNVTNMSDMFNDCSGLTTLDVTKFDTSKVTNMSGMFSDCSGLTTLDVSNFNTSNVTNISGMFFGCGSLTALDVSNFDTSNVTHMGNIDDNYYYSGTGIFAGCSGLTTLDVSNFNTSNVTNMSGMFSGCSGLTTLDISNFDFSNVTSMAEMFSGCSGLTTLDVSKFDTSKVTNMGDMFDGCSSLTTLDVTKFDTSKVTNMDGMFSDCSGLTTLDVTKFDTSNVIGMSRMFSGCSGLTTLDVTKFDTSNVIGMSDMFSGCSGLTTLDVSNFNTSNVTHMDRIFSGCSGLITLDLSNFNTSNVINMDNIFKDCSSLTTLDLSNFDTAQVTSMQYMFANCSSLIALDVSNFNVSKVRFFQAMFMDCSSLTTLDLTSFTPLESNGFDPYMQVMFTNCSSLVTIYANDWNLAQHPNCYDMFYNCVNLIGTNANNQTTPYNASNITGEMATPNGGYFTVSDKKTAIVNYIDDQGQVQKKVSFGLSQGETVLSPEKVLSEVPEGYEIKDPLPVFEVPVTGTTFDVVIQLAPEKWKATVNYVSNGNIVGTKEFQVTKDQPDILASDVQAGIPTDYEATGQITGFTATKDGQVFEVEVTPKEVQWTVTINYISNEKAVVGSTSFQVTNLNPVVTAAQIAGAIPTGYEEVGTIADVTATQDGQSFDVQVQPVSAPVVNLNATVQFVDQNGTVVGTKTFVVTDQNPVILAQELQAALPAGMTLVSPLQDLIVTQDGEVFTIELRTESPAEETWTITVEFKDEAGNVIGTGSFAVSSNNPVISATELSSQLPTGYKLLFNRPVTVLSESIVDGKGNIVVVVVPTGTGEPTPPKEETPNKNIGVNTSAKTLTGLYGVLGLGAVGVMSSILVKRKKKK